MPLEGRRGSVGPRRAYEVWHSTQGASEGQSQITLQPWHKNVLEVLGNVGGLRVLEVGCGQGNLSLRLAEERPIQIVAMDFSSVAVETLRARAVDLQRKVVCLVGDAQQMPFPEASFDVLVACEVLEHVLDPPSMAREIARVLRPGGIYVLTTENYFNGMILAWIKSWVTRAAFDSGSGIQPVENFFLWWKVRATLLKARLTVDRITSNHYQWLLLPGIDPAKLCTLEVKPPWLRKLLLPFGRHLTLMGYRW